MFKALNQDKPSLILKYHVCFLYEAVRPNNNY